MAKDSTGIKGQPKFLDSGAPDLATDDNLVSDYAAKVGNRRVGTKAEREAAAGTDVWEGLEWYDTTQLLPYVRRSGWKLSDPFAAQVRRVPATAAGSLSSGAGYINLAAEQTIPASPFGPGVGYTINVYGYSSSGGAAASGLAVRVRVDGADADVKALGQEVSAAGADVYPSVNASHTIATPDVTHKVLVQIAATGSVTVRTNAAGKQNISGFVISLTRDDTF